MRTLKRFDLVEHFNGRIAALGEQPEPVKPGIGSHPASHRADVDQAQKTDKPNGAEDDVVGYYRGWRYWNMWE